MTSAPQDLPEKAPHTSTWAWLVAATIARGYLVFVLALAACALLPMLTGLTASVVHSGSMLPHIHVGDVVLVRALPKTAPTPLGRVITFRAPAGSAVDGLVLHRLVAVNDDGTLVTAGDANATADSTPLARRDVIGQAVILVPWVGLPSLWLTAGALPQLLTWAALTALAVVIEVATPLSESRHHRRRRPWARSGPPHPRHAAEFLWRATLKPVALLLLLLLTVIVVSGSSVVQVESSFGAQTANVGDQWATKAAAPAVRLAFVTSPSGSTGGVAFAVQPAVVFQDASAHTTTSGGSVTLSLTSAGGAVLSCTANPVASGAGLSTFAGCAVDKAGTYTLTARSGALIPATSASFAITRGPASTLRFVTSPTATTANTTFTTTPIVSVVDKGGNIVASTASVTLSLTVANGAVLTCGVNPQTATAGQVSFPGCRVSLPGTYSLTARSPGLIAAVSSTFLIGGPAVALLSCQSATWIATFSWTPTPYATTTYRLYVNGIQVAATGADGWNSYVQLTSNNVPAATFPQGTATLEVRRVTALGGEVVVGDGSVLLGASGYRTYLCG